jgi:hypothetical protein
VHDADQLRYLADCENRAGRQQVLHLFNLITDYHACPTHRAPTLLLGLALFFTSHTKAFELWPELQFFDPKEISELEKPRNFDGEYHSDIRTFSRRLEDEAIVWTNENFYIGSTGSLSAKSFQVEERLRLRNQLSETTRAGIVYVQHEDFYNQQQNLLIELGHRFWPKIRTSVLANFLSNKQNLDIGFRLDYIWSDQAETTLSYWVPQHQFNSKSEDDGFFDASPWAIFAAHKWSQADHKSEVFGRYEPRLNLRNSAAGDRYIYSKWIAGFRRIQKHDSGAVTTLRLGFDNKYEAERSLNDPTDSEYWRMQRLEAEVAGLPAQRASWMPTRWGVRGLGKWWETLEQNTVEQFTALPFFEYSYSVGPASRADFLAIEYEQAYHWDNDNDKVSFNNVHDQTFNHRTNVTWAFVWPESGGRISFMFTFDMDRFGQGDTWEGGGGQAQFNF